ncbi:MAG: TonB-dependent receptor, partial [Nannocystaceae bacterium]|nr:TonB-dependent receptor [Nannocystaceae bacterium]
GAHELRLDWFGSYAQARRDDPSIRDMLFTQGAQGTPGLDPTSGGGKLLFLRLEDHTESGAANLSLPFEQWRQLGSRFKTGIWAEGKQREFNARRFAYTGNGLELPNGTGDVLTPESIGGGSPNDSQPFFITEGTQPQDNYRASQRLYAAYAMLELPIVRWFKIAGGARFEASDIRVEPFDPFDSGADLDGAGVRDHDVLPAAMFIFSPRSDMNIRLGGTRTLARPEFRELAKFEFTDFVGAFSVIGNPDLVSTKVWNADARWEWFPSVTEVVAASVFYKRFDKPIERVVFARSSGLASFSNAERAYNIGFELEFRKSLEFAAKALAPFSVGANFAYIHSQVRLSDAACDIADADCEGTLNVSTESRRPLQGQSPFVVNTYIDYTNTHGTNLRVLYNSFGRRIDQVSGLGLPDIYEEPRHLVDLVFGQEVYPGMTLSLSVDNALNWPRRFTQGRGRATTYRVRLGTSVKLGLGYTF